MRLLVELFGRRLHVVTEPVEADEPTASDQDADYEHDHNGGQFEPAPDPYYDVSDFGFQRQNREAR